MQTTVTILEIPIQEILEGDNGDARLYRDIMRWGIRLDRDIVQRAVQSDKIVALVQRLHNLESEDARRGALIEAYEDEETRKLFTFRFTELGKWLIDNHLPFLKEYGESHLPKSYRLHTKRNYIQSRLDALIRTGLITKGKMVKSEKNKTDTPQYSFTLAGEFLGYLIEARNKSKSTSAEDEEIHLCASQELFDLLDVDIKEDTDSLSFLLKKFFSKCKEKGGMFEELIDMWAPSIFSFYFPNQSNRLDIRQTLLTLPVISPDLGKIFLESLKGLDEQRQKLLLLQFKLDFESDYSEIRFYWNFKALKDWEMMRFQHIQDYSKVTLFGYCERGCESLYPFQMDIFKFIELPNLLKARPVQDSNQLETIDPKIDCLKCSKNNGLRILRSWLSNVLWVREEEKVQKLRISADGKI
jgi:hypothetical protein